MPTLTLQVNGGIEPVSITCHLSTQWPVTHLQCRLSGAPEELNGVFSLHVRDERHLVAGAPVFKHKYQPIRKGIFVTNHIASLPLK